MTNVTFDNLISRLENVVPYDRYVMSLCAFHNDSEPSMMVFRDGWFQCLGCGRRGNWNMLWDKVSGRRVTVTQEPRTSFRPPIGQYGLEDLCYQAHMDLLQFPSFQWYLEMRGIQDRIETNEIGYHLGWYTFPVRNEDGGFETAVFRAAPHVQEVSGVRYWCKSAPMMYVPDWFRVRHSKYLFVVYGMLDALTLSHLRLPVVTSTAGNNTFNPAWLDDFRVPIYIIPDLGEYQQSLKLASHLGWRPTVVQLSYPVGKKDTNGFLEAGQEAELLSQLSRYIKE